MIEEMISERQEASASAMEDNAEGLAGKGFGGGLGSSPRVVGAYTVREHMSTTDMVRANRSILVGVLCWEEAPVGWPASIIPTVAPNVAAAHRKARRNSPEFESQSCVPRLIE